MPRGEADEEDLRTVQNGLTVDSLYALTVRENENKEKLEKDLA